MNCCDYAGKTLWQKLEKRWISLLNKVRQQNHIVKREKYRFLYGLLWLCKKNSIAESRKTHSLLFNNMKQQNHIAKKETFWIAIRITVVM